jgi:hypothetical protein
MKGEKKKNKTEETVKIKKENESRLAEFTKRPLPTEKEVEEFEEYVKSETEETEETFDLDDELEEEIEESLSEIYQDDKGFIVDVKKMAKARRRGFFFWSFILLLVSTILAGAGWLVYSYFYLHAGLDVTALDFSLNGRNEVVAGEETVYTLTYRNTTNIPFQQARLEISYPDKFIVLDTYPVASSTNNSVWEIGEIPPLSTQTVKIKGMMLGPAETTGVILANLVYVPVNFSSEFKKEATLAITIKDIGLDFDIDYLKSALVGEENEALVRFKAQEKNFINSFRLLVESTEGVRAVTEEKYKKDDLANFSQPRPGIWEVKEIKPEDNVLPLNIIFTDQATGDRIVKLKFETLGPDNNYYQFKEEDLGFEVLKSDLNLTLIVNGSRQDQGVDFGQALNYSIVYNNKGDTDMKDVAIMAVLESDFLDWSSLDDKLGGQRRGNTIIWTKEELPALAKIAQHDEGTIDFSINVASVDKIESGKNYEIKSYAQFSVGDRATSTASNDNRSNIIVNKINSDLNLDEEVRYFNDDNITVGNGPLPLRVGKKTSFKVYWTVANTLHELEEVKVVASLPPYVSWDDKSRATVGSIYYDAENHRVIWDIGRMPLNLFRADAEFNISVVPTADDVDKIIVLKPGSRLTAKDTVTGAEIIRITDAKTSKLEDDQIVQQNNDGVVRK